VDVAELFATYGPAIFRRCRALLGSDDAAHDAVQEVFMRSLDRAATFRGDAAPFSWLYAIATTHCLQQLRNARSHGEKLAQLPTESQHGSGSDERLLWEAILSQLDPSTQRIAFLRHVDGMTLEEVAEVVGLTRKTVAKKLAAFAAIARLALTEGQ
jgi:RNA polymerase sigma-70 factor (ECF subfamily)